MGSYFFQGIMLGAAAGISCFIFCLPVYLGASINNRNNSIVNFSYFTIGRFAAYLSVGVVAPLIGKQFLQISYFDPVAKIITGILLLYWGVKGFTEKNKMKKNKNCPIKKSSSLNPIAAGFLTGISPCPPFLAGIALAMSGGSVNTGAIFFTGFFISTTLFLMPFFAVGILKYKEELKIISQFISIISGALFSIYGIIKFL
jgi:sulfite exporter TauE/SafE